MGSVLGTAASGVGALVGNVVSSPFNGVACERVCSGTWDLLCFIEHLCVTSLLKFILAVILALIVLYAFYPLCKLGVVKCLAKNTCKLAYTPCRLLCHLWRKVRDTDRVYRGRRGRRRRDPDDDVELGDLSTSSYDDYRGSPSPSPSPSDYSRHRGVAAAAAAAGRSRRESSSSPAAAARERRKDRFRQSLRPRRASSKVEHAMKMSREGESERRHHHHPHSMGARRKQEAASSLHGHGSPPRDHSHAHRHRRAPHAHEKAQPCRFDVI